ncbi:MAG: hypothetical protein LRY75_17640 [Shewanella xiamenensis]|nr:hypothetical protein [Shewanella xiamenensis]
MSLNVGSLSDTFLSMTDSLSKYRRADLKDGDGNNLIEELYVDPLENDLILKSMLKENTTLLMGRKGTGKSTIINRFQHEIRKSENKLSLYIDVKALFEQARKSYFSLQSLDIELTPDSLDRLSLYVFFIEKIISEIQDEIKSSVFKSKFKRFFIQDGLTEKEFNKQLDILFKSVKKPLFVDVTACNQIVKSETGKSSRAKDSNLGFEFNAQKQSVNGGIKDSSYVEDLESKQFTQVLSRFFDIIGFMNNLKKLLKKFLLILFLFVSMICLKLTKNQWRFLLILL